MLTVKIIELNAGVKIIELNAGVKIIEGEENVEHGV